jgi:HAD superfamily hydrolase (TIGR01450 family)
VLDLSHVKGFVFDIDGTLLHRDPDGRGHPQPGAPEVLQRIRDTGRRVALFTNGSNTPSAGIAAGLRRDGLEVSDDEMITPTDSATTYLLRNHADEPVQVFAAPAVLEHMAQRGVRITEGEDARAVLVLHLHQVDLDEIERAARAVDRGAPIYTGSYVRGYAGAKGMIYSRGAMITAAIAKVTGVRPRVLGKPSRAAVAEVSTRLEMPAADVAVVGDDLGMDIALGRMGGCTTVLVRSGISGQIDLAGVPERRRPDAAIDGVVELLGWL